MQFLSWLIFMDLQVQLGVGKATLSYWMLKLNIEYRKVALAPGESIEIRRLSG